MSEPNAAASGQFAIGGDLVVNRLGFGAMRITGKGIWGEPEDREEQHRTEGENRPKETNEEQHCYVCKQTYRELHPFYDQLCPPCAEFNFAKRSETADLEGRVAVLTGGRVKIGYQAGIKLLRAGARLIVTTRFPRDSAARYAQEPDFDQWGERLEIYGLDLRHTPSVESFCHHLLTTHDRLDYIVNNACQTVRRPPEFYRHMLDAELASEHTLAPEVQRLLGAYAGLRRYEGLLDHAILSSPSFQLSPERVQESALGLIAACAP